MHTGKLLPSSFLGLVAAFGVLASISAQEVKTASLAVSASDFAVDPKTGDVGAVDPKQNLVLLYKIGDSPSGIIEPTLRVTAGNVPASIVFKQVGDKRYFVVGCLKEANIYVFNADDLKQVAKIQVTGSDVASLAVSQSPADPYVYYCHGRGHDSKAGGVNLVTLADDGQMFDDSMDCAISARGNYAYRRGPWSPSGFESLRKVLASQPGGKPTFQRVFYDHNSTAQYVPDTAENYTAAGSKLYTVTLDKSVADLPMVPYCFFNDKPIIAGIQGGDPYSYRSPREKSPDTKLILASYNTFTKIGEATISGDFLKRDDSSLAGPGAADFKHVGYRLRMFADDARGRVLTLRRDQVALLKLADLKLPDEGFLAIEAENADALIAGRKNTVKLRTRDSRISVELLDKPGDMALTAAGLEWTPAEDAVGEQTVRFKLSHAGIDKTDAVTLTVGREATTLPFEPDGLRIAPDGKSAVAWTVINRRDHFGRPSQTLGETVPRCAVIELPEGKVVATGSLPFPADLVAIDKHQIYAVQSGSAVVAAIDRATFGVKKQITLEGTLTILTPIDDQWLVVATPEGRRIKYSAPDLNLVADLQSAVIPTGAMLMSMNEAPRPSLSRVSTGWAFGDGDIFDEKLERPVLLKQTPTFISPLPNKLQELAPQRLQAVIPGERMMPHMGGESSKFVLSVAQTSPTTSVALTHVARNEQVPGSTHTWRSIQTYSLDIYEAPRFDTPKRSIPLLRGSDNRQTASGGERVRRGAVVLHDGVAYCAFANKLAKVVPIADSSASPAVVDVPPSFELKQSAVVLDRAGSTRLTHSVTGGKQPYQFALMNPFAGAEISPSDGTVTIDGSKVVESALDALVGTADRPMPGRAQGNLATSEAVETYVARNTANFKQLTGRDPAGVPVTLAIEVQATDSTPRTTRLSYQTLIEIPRDKIDERIKKLADARAAAIAAQQAQAAAAGAQGGGGGGAANDARIQALEQRILALEAQLNILTKILSDSK